MTSVVCNGHRSKESDKDNDLRQEGFDRLNRLTQLLRFSTMITIIAIRLIFQIAIFSQFQTRVRNVSEDAVSKSS